jgi:RND family efflux transporter MFP subunit
LDCDPYREWTKPMRCRLASPFCLLVATLIGCGPTPSLAPSPTPKVTVSRPLPREVSDYEDFSGRTDAVGNVDIRARVTGYLIKVDFQEGDVVGKDKVLYEIDPRPFQAALDQANGQLERLEAEKKLLEIQVDRYRKLAEKGAGSQQQLDQYTAQQAENVGALKAAHAQVALAALNLGFTRVTAPITGKISRTLITEGNLVTADTTLLTTIRSVDPMHAYFDIEEPTMLRIQKMLRDGVIRTKSIREVRVAMGLADDIERKFPFHGTLDFVNNTVDPQTGTIQVRGVFPNPYTPGQPPALTPGTFSRVRLPIGQPHSVLLVAEQAIGTDQGQKFVYVVDQDNKIAYRRVKLGLLFDGLQAVEEGLQSGQRVVVVGIQRVRPGIEVETDEAEMSALAGPAQSPSKPSGKPAPGKTSAAAGASVKPAEAAVKPKN